MRKLYTSCEILSPFWSAKFNLNQQSQDEKSTNCKRESFRRSW